VVAAIAKHHARLPRLRARSSTAPQESDEGL